MTSVPETVEVILDQAIDEAREEDGYGAPAIDREVIITRAVSRLEALWPKPPMGGEVEEAVARLRQLKGWLDVKCDNHRMINEPGDAENAEWADAQSKAIDTILAALAQGPKEAAQPPSLTFSDEQVERAARAGREARVRAYDETGGSLFGKPWTVADSLTCEIAGLRAALSTLEPK